MATYMNYGDDSASNKVLSADIFWLKLSNSSIQAFLKLIQWYTISSQVFLRYMLDRICTQIASEMVNFWAKTSIKLYKMTGKQIESGSIS